MNFRKSGNLKNKEEFGENSNSWCPGEGFVRDHPNLDHTYPSTKIPQEICPK